MYFCYMNWKDWVSRSINTQKVWFHLLSHFCLWLKTLITLVIVMETKNTTYRWGLFIHKGSVPGTPVDKKRSDFAPAQTVQTAF